MLKDSFSRSPFMSAKQCGMLSLLMVAGFACSDDDSNPAMSSAGGASGAAGSGGFAALEAGLMSEGAAGLGGQPRRQKAETPIAGPSRRCASNEPIWSRTKPMPVPSTSIRMWSMRGASLSDLRVWPGSLTTHRQSECLCG